MAPAGVADAEARGTQCVPVGGTFRVRPVACLARPTARCRSPGLRFVEQEPGEVIRAVPELRLDLMIGGLSRGELAQQVEAWLSMALASADRPWASEFPGKLPVPIGQAPLGRRRGAHHRALPRWLDCCTGAERPRRQSPAHARSRRSGLLAFRLARGSCPRDETAPISPPACQDITQIHEAIEQTVDHIETEVASPSRPLAQRQGSRHWRHGDTEDEEPRGQEQHGCPGQQANTPVVS